MEEQYDILGYEGLYTINRNGEIYNKMGLKRKPRERTDGYLYYGLYKEGKQKSIYIHRLLGLQFIPNPDNKLCIDHINRNKQDNRIENLRWATHTENMNNRNRPPHKGGICERKTKDGIRFSIHYYYERGKRKNTARKTYEEAEEVLLKWREQFP